MNNTSLLDYRMPTALDLPMIEAVIVEVPNPGHPFGIRGGRGGGDRASAGRDGERCVPGDWGADDGPADESAGGRGVVGTEWRVRRLGVRASPVLDTAG